MALVSFCNWHVGVPGRLKDWWCNFKHWRNDVDAINQSFRNTQNLNTVLIIGRLEGGQGKMQFWILEAKKISSHFWTGKFVCFAKILCTSQEVQIGSKWLVNFQNLCLVKERINWYLSNYHSKGIYNVTYHGTCGTWRSVKNRACLWWVYNLLSASIFPRLQPACCQPFISWNKYFL